MCRCRDIYISKYQVKMKKILLLLLVTIGHIVHGNLYGNAIAPTCTDDNNWTLWPNELDCHKFYICINGIPEEFNCQDNYHFNETVKHCTFGPCSTPNFFANTSSKNTGTTDGKNNVCLPYEVKLVHDDCVAYSACINGTFKQQQCPAGKYFSVQMSSCQPIAANVQHKCRCILPQYTALANVDDCTTYYTCLNGKAVLEKCPPNHYYDERISSCVLDTNHHCIPPPQPTMSPGEIAISQACEKFNIDGMIFQPHPDDCTKFMICLNGRSLIKQCQVGFYYDRQFHYCRVDMESKCLKNDTIVVNEAASFQIESIMGSSEAVEEKVEIEENAEVQFEKIKTTELPKVQLNSPIATEVDISSPKKSAHNKLSSKFITF